jgi:hypothetical protein
MIWEAGRAFNDNMERSIYVDSFYFLEFHGKRRVVATINDSETGQNAICASPRSKGEGASAKSLSWLWLSTCNN